MTALGTTMFGSMMLFSYKNAPALFARQEKEKKIAATLDMQYGNNLKQMAKKIDAEHKGFNPLDAVSQSARRLEDDLPPFCKTFYYQKQQFEQNHRDLKLVYGNTQPAFHSGAVQTAFLMVENSEGTGSRVVLKHPLIQYTNDGAFRAN